MWLLNMVCQHGPTNLIVVEDNKEVAEMVANLEEGKVVFLTNQSVQLSPEDEGQLVPIEDEDL